jgi:multiple sugar transport system permease protein
MKVSIRQTNNPLKTRRKWIKRGKILLFLLPALVPLCVFWLYPAIDTLYLSFTDWDYVTPTYNMVGFENYTYLFKTSTFLKALIVTIRFSVITIVFSLTLGLLLALAIFKNRRFNGILKFLYFSPWVTPTVAVSIVWVFMFDQRAGIINYMFQLIGLEKVNWLGSSKTALIPIMVVTIWSSIGWNMIFYLGALSKVPKDLYEAADIDGVSGWTALWKITLPLISPTTLFLVVLSTIGALQAYSTINIMTKGGPAGSTQTLLYLYYLNGFDRFEVGRAATVAVILIVITAVLSAIQFWISKHTVHYN